MSCLDSEQLEIAALRALHSVATPELESSLGIRRIDLPAGVISIAEQLPASAIVINRALGFVAEGELDTQLVEQTAAHYQSTEVGRFFIQISEQFADHLDKSVLDAIGLTKARAWQKFVRPAQSVGPMKSDFEIRQIGVENGEAFARIACAGFDLGEDAVPWLARLPSAENWHALMCFSEGRPAAAGALYAEGGAGWLDFASTDSEFRCRGAQTALLSARLNLANQLGCQKVYTCTGVDVEGDPQHSYNNILRAGFQMDYVRDNYAPITA